MVIEEELLPALREVAARVAEMTASVGAVVPSLRELKRCLRTVDVHQENREALLEVIHATNQLFHSLATDLTALVHALVQQPPLPDDPDHEEVAPAPGDG